MDVATAPTPTLFAPDEPGAEFRLLRLILIDSYARGKTVELDVGGHVAITGENASGKTTLLRLFPLFFGEAPSKVIQSDENNHKFSRHYLPTQASYVIFEYARRGRCMLSVIHPDGQSDGVCYRFIDSPYRPDLFRDARGLVQSADLTRHLTKLGVTVTKALSLSTYRQILQNEAGREFRQLASLFAFTGSGSRLKHIERVVSSILLRATSFHDLKRMVVTSVHESAEPFAMRTSKRELMQWISEYEAHARMMEKSPVMEELDLADQQRRRSVDEFSRLAASFQLIGNHLTREIQTGEREYERLRTAAAELIKHYSQALLALQDAANQKKSVLREAMEVLANADRRHVQYQKEKADDRARCVSNLPLSISSRDRLRTRLAELEESSRSVVEVFDKMATDARSDADAATRGIERERTEALLSFNTLQAETFSRHAAVLKAFEVQQNEERHGVQQSVSQCREDVARATAEAKNPAADPEIQQAFDLDTEAFREASIHVDTVRSGNEPLERKVQKARQVFTDEETMLNASMENLEKAQLALRDLIEADNAGETTLIGFLRAHKPDWATNIGRLLPEQTLLRTDLAPVLSGGEDLYGVSLDLDHLESSRLASEQSIQEEIAHLRANVEKRAADVAADEKRLQAAERQRAAATEALAAHNVLLNHAVAAKNAADQRVKTSRARLTASRDAARRAAEAALSTSKTKLDQARAAQTTVENRLAAERRELDERHATEMLQLTTGHAGFMSQITTRLSDVATTLKTRLEDIDARRDEALKANGVDTTALTPIRRDIEELDIAITAAENDRTYVQTYQDWLELTWSRRPQLETDVAEAKRLKGLADEACSAKQQERDRAVDLNTKEQETVDKQITALSKQLTLVKGQLANLSTYPPDAGVLAGGFDNRIAVDLLINQRRELQASFAELQQRIREGVDDIRRQMIAIIGTGPEKLHHQILQRIGYPIHNHEHLWVDELRGWFQHEHIQNKDNLVQFGKTHAQNISAFWSGLGNFKKLVGNFAADLKAHLHQGQVFANISDVSVIISTDVEKQGYWKAIEALHDEYDAWHAMGDALPPPAFIAAAKEVALVLSDDKGLVADPIDLIDLQVTANIDGDGVKSARHEAALARMSSNGLSYIILVVILIGFVNRIRRKEKVVVPFVVDELKDLSVGNATALLDLLARNNITLVSAFPDVDPDLAPLFRRNYKILPGRTLATVKLEAEGSAHV